MRVNGQWRRVGITKGILLTVILLISCQYLVNVFITKHSTITLNLLQSSFGNGSSLFSIGRQYVTKKVQLEKCPYISPNLRGRFFVKTEVPAWISLEEKYAMLEPGGRYKPPDCMSRNRVAIIIPYRDREIHLKIFLNNLHAFLQKQQLDYGIFVVEMAAGVSFNRALLMNVGYKEASKLYEFDCFIFHDVDLIPEDDRNLYSCPQSPRHMSVAIDRMNYKLPYTAIFGGVSALSKKDFESVNGFSNLYFGWGGEDDDMYRRIVYSGLTVIRYSPVVARYRMLVHAKDKENPNRYKLLKTVKSRLLQDGLNSLNYTILRKEFFKLYTWVLISVNETQILNDESVHQLAMEKNKVKQQTVNANASSAHVSSAAELQQRVIVGSQRQQTQQQEQKQPAKIVRKKPQPPKTVNWLPDAFNGTLPQNLTRYDPLPIKTPSPQDLKKRQAALAALRAKNKQSANNSNSGPKNAVAPNQDISQSQAQAQALRQRQIEQQQRKLEEHNRQRIKQLTEQVFLQHQYNQQLLQTQQQQLR